MDLYKHHFLFIQDFNEKEVPAGGAEITDSYVIKAAEDLGLDISVSSSKSIRSSDFKENTIVILSNNYELFSGARNKIIDNHKYIAYSHDIGRWSEVYRQNNKLFFNSLGNIFLSPLHRDFFTGKTNNNDYCIPPFMPGTFRDLHEERSNHIMYAGNLFLGKGIEEVISLAKEKPDYLFHFYFQRYCMSLKSQISKLNNCVLKGYVPKEEINKAYNKYKYFIHIPKEIEAFGRAVSEAYLSGCEIITNDKVGAFSYGWSAGEFKQNTQKGHYLFWDTVKKMV